MSVRLALNSPHSAYLLSPGTEVVHHYAYLTLGFCVGAGDVNLVAHACGPRALVPLSLHPSPFSLLRMKWDKGCLLIFEIFSMLKLLSF